MPRPADQDLDDARGPFRWEGKHYNYRVVNPWMVPVQKPHAPIWVPGTASPETAQWAGSHGYTYVAFLTALDVTKELFDIYRESAVAARLNSVPLSEQSFEDLKDNYHIVCGTPDTVLQKLEYLHSELGMEHLIMYGQESKMDHEATMSNISLFGKEVLPVIKDW